MWDNVRGKILTALFLLAHTWDMGSLLAISSEAGNHMLVSFIHKQHSLQRELLLRPEPTFEELAQDLEEINSLVDRLPAHTRSNEDRQFTDLRCMRCERHISTVSPRSSLTVHAGLSTHYCVVNTVSCMSCLCQ